MFDRLRPMTAKIMFRRFQMVLRRPHRFQRLIDVRMTFRHCRRWNCRRYDDWYCRRLWSSRPRRKGQS